MAVTTNYSWNLPTVGGNQDQWGDLLNANWTALDTLLGGVTSTELDYLDGVTSNVQTQLNSLSSSISSLNSIPSGGIILWSGSTASIPSGWYLCNGANGTPDLRDRFVVGAGSSYGVGATGGAASVTLSTSNLPSHSHSFSGSTSTNGSHNHGSGTASNYTNSNGNYSSASGNYGLHSGIATLSTQIATTSDGSHSHSFSGTTGATGSGSAHENRPPYYALAYIMKA